MERVKTYFPTAAVTAAWIIGTRELPPVKITLVILSYKIIRGESSTEEKNGTNQGHIRVSQRIRNGLDEAASKVTTRTLKLRSGNFRPVVDIVGKTFNLNSV